MVVFVVVAVLLSLISIVVIFINVFVHLETVLDIHHLLVFIFVVLLLQVIVLLLWWDNAFVVIFVFRPLVLVDNILSDHLMLQVVFTNDLLVLLIDHASFTFFFSVAFEVVIVHAGLGGVVVLVNDGLLLFAFAFTVLSLLHHLLLFSLLLLLQE